MGLWKGKKGSSVFYKIKYSNNKEKQGIREYQAEVSNPQTDAQADVRSKLLPAQAIRGALRDIVSRSFQGVEYGAKSRLEFMKYAMMDNVRRPYVIKGTNQPVPGEYLIAKGTLPQVYCTFDGSIPQFKTSLNVGDLDDFDITIGELSTALLTNSPQLQSGDQLTFVGCVFTSPGTGYATRFDWYYYSILLDETNVADLATIPGYYTMRLQSSPNASSDAGRSLVMQGAYDNLCAAAVIHSRRGEDGLYLRSTTYITLSDDPEVTYYYTDRQQAVTRASYQTRAQTRGGLDWPVEQDESTMYTVESVNHAVSGITGAAASLNGEDVWVQRRSDTLEVIRVYASSDSTEGNIFLVTEEGNKLSYTSGSDVLYLRQDQVPSLAGLPYVLYTRNANSRRTYPAPEDGAMPESSEAVKTTKKATKKATT